jgi:hypothetical protein
MHIISINIWIRASIYRETLVMTSIQKHKAIPYLQPSKKDALTNRGIKETVSATISREPKKRRSKKPAEHLA